MKEIHKAFKVRIYPTKAQAILIDKHIGCSRFVYNYMLSIKETAYKLRKTKLSKYDLCKFLTLVKKVPKYNWLSEVSNAALKAAIFDMDRAYQNFFAGRAKFAKYKKRLHAGAFRAEQKTKIENGKLSIEKFREGIKVSHLPDIDGTLLYATIVRDSVGYYFASLTCKINYKPMPLTGGQIGVDVGIADLAILNDGTKYENKRPYKKALKKLKYKARQLSKKKDGSNRKEIARKELAKVHRRIGNIRKDAHHKATHDIVKNNDFIAVETLRVKNLLKNHNIAQAMSDSGLSYFLGMLKYKAEWNDRKLIEVESNFPSSKLCGECGYINTELTLAHRKWECPSCNTVHDRDVNAARNLLVRGLEKALQNEPVKV